MATEKTTLCSRVMAFTPIADEDRYLTGHGEETWNDRTLLRVEIERKGEVVLRKEVHFTDHLIWKFLRSEMKAGRMVHTGAQALTRTVLNQWREERKKHGSEKEEAKED